MLQTCHPRDVHQRRYLLYWAPVTIGWQCCILLNFVLWYTFTSGGRCAKGTDKSSIWGKLYFMCVFWNLMQILICDYNAKVIKLVKIKILLRIAKTQIYLFSVRTNTHKSDEYWFRQLKRQVPYPDTTCLLYIHVLSSLIGEESDMSMNACVGDEQSGIVFYSGCQRSPLACIDYIVRVLCSRIHCVSISPSIHAQGLIINTLLLLGDTAPFHFLSQQQQWVQQYSARTCTFVCAWLNGRMRLHNMCSL